MRIEAYNAMSQIYSAKKPTKVTGTSAASRTDQVSISSFGRDMQNVRQAIANSSDIRSDITEPLKSRIQSGEYKVNSDDFAGKLLEKFGEKYSF
ncbi:MAG: flagellar biosynthesis anti-sigma factor FlgM [Lachnospiraceae bacterium]|nr:flagellar biosynthesis anti-sigma factor FlgM [Lachnospiraceae bacterium]